MLSKLTSANGTNRISVAPTVRSRRVALVQRYIPHYRLPLFQKLSSESRYRWSFFCDSHPGGDFSGLAVADPELLDVRRIRNHMLGGPFIYQSGINVNRPEFDALMVDLGWTIASNPVILARARARGLPTIGWSKGVAQDGERQKSRCRLAVERWLTFRCDTIVAYGQTSRDYFIRLGFPPERVFVAQNTVDTARIARERDAALAQCAELRDALSLPNRPIVGFLGKIAPAKQVNRIVAAYELARRAGMDALLVVAGKGPGRSALEAQIAASPFRTDIYYVPEVPVGAEAGYFQLFDLYLSFSQGGLGILEAMAHGRAVLSTPERFPETELLEDGSTGFISADLTIESFAQRMRAAIASTGQRTLLGSAAEQRVLAEATQERMVERIDSAVECAFQNRLQRA